MAISAVSKFHIFAHLSIKEPILSDLQKLGCVEISHIEEKAEFHNWKDIEEDTKSGTSVKLNNIKFCIELLSSYGSEKRRGLNSFFPSKKFYSYNDLVKISQQFDYEKLFTQCKELDNELNRIKLQENKLINAKQEIEKWQDLELDFNKIDKRKYIKYILGSITKKYVNNLLFDIEHLVKTTIIQTIKEEKNKLNIIIITLKENQPKIDSILQKYHFEIYKYSYSFTGTPKQILKTISEQLMLIDKRRSEIAQILIKLHRDNQLIYPLYDYLSIIHEKEETKKYLKKSEKIIVVKGWIQNKDITKLQKRLEKNYTEYEIDFTKPKKDEQIPVALNNNNLVKPFEIITELYSLPNYHEIDPTPILSIFYFVFFGLCLSDVGYGASMALISYIAIKKIKLGEGPTKFFKLLYYCGISGIFGGILVGSWFGDILNFLPPMFSNLRNVLIQKLALFEPTDNPLPLLILSLTLGVIQVYTGIILKFIDNIRNGKLYDGLMDQISWLFLLTGIILVLLKSMMPSIIGKISWIIALIGILTIVLTQGRTKNDILLRIGSGVLALYDITGYFSDVLSYSRLFALGLATGIIAQMFNMLSTMVNIPYIGFLLTIIILIIGHTFNLLISGLSAFIHDARLQYVEFFTKFYQAGGTPFKPFALKTKYIKVEEDV
ncbi:MAG: V-type ATP synthase subunit I [Atribacterota bacterium]|nr:V-type ATP synthase subunit I [Atribacterota bacterium]MDD4896869.1 V-type ATP synthase subunit I [Atribacterota bacterium]MDD5636294.1 V-type ATP synthase subunit I [Atribacterota bacterium]